jgi:hypothetical protein
VISKEDGSSYVNINDMKKPKTTTRGWELLISWKDGTSSWVKLKDLKESFPVQLAESDVGNKISEEPAFAWWVPYTIRKRRDHIILKVKSKYWKRTHKFGIRLPKTVDGEALHFNNEDSTDIWKKVIEKEMKNRKMDSLQRKARVVANGNERDPTKHMTYSSSVVSSDSVCLFFLITALNNLDVLSADIQKVSLQMPVNSSQ